MGTEYGTEQGKDLERDTARRAMWLRLRELGVEAQVRRCMCAHVCVCVCVYVSCTSLEREAGFSEEQGEHRTGAETSPMEV